jgi:hypothetical protein
MALGDAGAAGAALAMTLAVPDGAAASGTGATEALLGAG